MFNAYVFVLDVYKGILTVNNNIKYKYRLLLFGLLKYKLL